MRSLSKRFLLTRRTFIHGLWWYRLNCFLTLFSSTEIIATAFNYFWYRNVFPSIHQRETKASFVIQFYKIVEIYLSPKFTSGKLSPILCKEFSYIFLSVYISLSIFPTKCTTTMRTSWILINLKILNLITSAHFKLWNF